MIDYLMSTLPPLTHDHMIDYLMSTLSPLTHDHTNTYPSNTTLSLLIHDHTNTHEITTVNKGNFPIILALRRINSWNL